MRVNLLTWNAAQTGIHLKSFRSSPKNKAINPKHSGTQTACPPMELTFTASNTCMPTEAPIIQIRWLPVQKKMTNSVSYPIFYAGAEINTGKAAHFILSDLSGKQLQTLSFLPGTHAIETAHLATGFYILQSVKTGKAQKFFVARQTPVLFFFSYAVRDSLLYCHPPYHLIAGPYSYSGSTTNRK